MRVRMLLQKRIGTNSHDAGEVVNLPRPLALRLIRDGIASELEETGSVRGGEENAMARSRGEPR